MHGIKVKGQGPVVILLHSSLSSSKQWLPLCHELVKNFTVINIDLLGYGDAAMPAQLEKYCFEDEIVRINTILAELEINEAVHLVGHSCGGAVALAWAMKNQHRVASLALFEPVAFHLLKDNHPKQFAEINEFAMHLRDLDDGDAVAQFVNFWNGSDFFEKLPAKVQQQMTVAMKKVHADFNGILKQPYHLSDLATLTCPSLIIVGELTQPVSKVLSQSIANNLAKVKLTHVPYGHMAPVSHSAVTTPIIAQFLLSVISKR